MNEDWLRLGMRIKDRRLQQGMTQDELAIAAGYKGKASIAKIEKGITRTPLERLVRIAAALHTSYAFLMGVTNNPDDPEYTAMVDRDVSALEQLVAEENQQHNYEDAIKTAISDHATKVVQICTTQDIRNVPERIRLVTDFVEENANCLLSAFIGPVDDEPDPNWTYLEERVQSGAATPQERTRYWEIMQSIASGAGERMSKHKIRVLDNMDKLNEEGQEKVAEYADDLVRSGKHPATDEAEDGAEDA